MAVSEQAYLVVSNLTKLRYAKDLLSDVIVEEGSIDESTKKEALGLIFKLLAKYERKTTS